MLKYLIIPLADDAVSFCHYDRAAAKSNLIPLETLRKAIFWAMKENLTIQFLYPDRELPEEYRQVIDSIDHATIVSARCADGEAVDAADVVVLDSWTEASAYSLREATSYVVRTTVADFVGNLSPVRELLRCADRLVVILTDLDRLTESDVGAYGKALGELVPAVVKEYESGHSVQFNLLTDRLYLDKMNNCNAGCESLTLAPDGRFYVCPAFYFGGAESEGDLEVGPAVRNGQLYRLDHAPICRECDAYHCRRCVWLNRKRTLEVNTPGRMQCVVAHTERNASRRLLAEIRKIGEFMPGKEIAEIDYMDPFEKIG